MNLVGKIFVVLVFVMSITFAAFSVVVFATHRSWKDEVLRTEAPPGGQVGWKKRLADQDSLFADLQQRKQDAEDQFATERAAKRQHLIKLEQEKERLKVEADESVKKFQEQAEAHQVALVGLESAQNRLDVLRTESETLRKEVTDVRTAIDKKYSESLAVTERLHQAQGDLQRLKVRQKQLVGELAIAQEVMSVNGWKPNDQLHRTAPAIDGFVTRVQKHQDDIYVEVTIGSDDGLKNGDTMEVYRGASYLGRIRIVRTTSDRSVGKVDRNVQRGEIRARDRVETRQGLKLTAG